MNDKELRKAVKMYTKMFSDALEKKGFPDAEDVTEQYSKRLTDMYRSDKFIEHNKYPSIDMKKVYAVIAMCLLLKENGLSNDEIIDFVNFVFRKLKKAFYTLEKIIDSLPCAYRIAEKWNINDHRKRTQDSSVIYDSFEIQDGRIEYNISKCMYVETFADYGIRELCKIFCITDIQGYAMLPNHVNFIRYSDLSDGDCCHDVITRKY